MLRLYAKRLFEMWATTKIWMPVVPGVLACLLWQGAVAAAPELPAAHQKLIDTWIAQHPQYRLASLKDCQCGESIREMRKGWGGAGRGTPGRGNICRITVPLRSPVDQCQVSNTFDGAAHSLGTKFSSLYLIGIDAMHHVVGDV